MINIIRNVLKKGFFLLMVKKLLKRLEKNNSILATKWAESKVKLTTTEFCQNIDKKQYVETVSEVARIKEDAKTKLSYLKFSLGGGGNYFLLYFLVRKFCPKITIETGVAAGWSSLSILRALHKNKVGKLYSSDFPYFRIKNPEKLIGILVQKEPNLKDWILDIRGDDIALLDFAKKLDDSSVDLFHYDSDKSYSGRENALRVLNANINSKTVIIFDDIQNNLHFRDFVKKSKSFFYVLEFESKFIGIVGSELLFEK